jgi:glycosyltransferase involved in cell wall biosynthesis
MKVAIVHYWLINMRGGEAVLSSLLEIFPDADIYTHVYEPTEVTQQIRAKTVRTSFINKLPFAKKYYKYYLPLMPLALEQLDLTDYDLVISSEAGPAKGVITRPDAFHICYCHSPMRYIWDMTWQYQQNTNIVIKWLMAPVLHYLRMWDQSSASRPDVIVANSTFTQQRIRKFWGRDAMIIHPPVAVADTELVAPSTEYYVYAGELVGYKRGDLAVDAFNINGRPLIVLGAGEELQRLESIANSNITFIGRVDDDVFQRTLAGAKALIFPGVEDFGITPVEAISLQTPVIAFGRGGALDSIEEGKTGLFFYEQTIDAVNAAVNRFESLDLKISAEYSKEIQRQFSVDQFKMQFEKLVNSL